MTTPRRWPDIDRIVLSALELEPAERAAFLNEVCGDDERLRKEVDSLLANEPPQRRVTGAPVEEATQLLAARSPAIKKLGRYQIVRSLGPGAWATSIWDTTSN